MAGLGAVKENKGTFLSVAGGYIWDRKADKSNPHYATQTYTKKDKTEGTRAGAQYGDLLGKVVSVVFREHNEYGQSINVGFEAEGELFIVSIGTNNRNSQDLMRALLVADLDQDLYMRPYDFQDKQKKRVQGISFKQNGEKLNLRVDGAPSESAEWFKSAAKKDVRRFFEDLSDWYVGMIQENVIPVLLKKNAKREEPKKSGLGTPKSENVEAPNTGNDVEAPPTIEELGVQKPKTQPKKEVSEKPTVIKMRRFLKSYIEDNYGEGYSLPKLSKDDVSKWYDLAQEGEELPLEEDKAPQVENEEPQQNVQDALDALMG